MRRLPETLNPYTKNGDIWWYPADTGYIHRGVYEDDPFDTRPSSFEKYGNSYLYNTEFVLEDAAFSSVREWSENPPFGEWNASQLVIYYDASGRWHIGFNSPPRLADGHARVLPQSDLRDALATDSGDPPTP